MSLKHEFEAAFDYAWDNNIGIHTGKNAAYWAAAWMLERIARDAEPYSVMLTEHIRELAKELEGEK